MADATVLKTVGLIIRTGSSPVSDTTRKPKPVERSTGFDFTTAKFTAKLFILPLLGFRLAPSGTHQTPSPIKGVPFRSALPDPFELPLESVRGTLRAA